MQSVVKNDYNFSAIHYRQQSIVNRGSEPLAWQASAIHTDVIEVQERFFLQLLMAFIIVGDPEQCLELCQAFFFREGHNMSGYSRLFKANLHRIKGLAILNIVAMMASFWTEVERKSELKKVKQATDKALRYF